MGGVTVFTGENGSGKTNLLEAVSLCSIGRSPRTPRDRELIQWGEDRAKIRVTTSRERGEESVEIILSKFEKKRISLCGIPISRIGELMGSISTVFFSPTELKIIQGGPSERRSFIDIAICQVSKSYFYLLNRYQKILSQRNRLLKSKNFTNDVMEIWDSQLAREGAKIIKTRRGFTFSLAPLVEKNHLFLSGGREALNIEYDGLRGENLEELEAVFLRELKADSSRDIKLGYTHTGPHKDDLIAKIKQNDIRNFGSQGQQRTAALALKLGELELNHKTNGAPPILLLDDVLSELDINRQKKLIERMEGHQTIITCTHLEPHIRNAVPVMNELLIETLFQNVK